MNAGDRHIKMVNYCWSERDREKKYDVGKVVEITDSAKE